MNTNDEIVDEVRAARQAYAARFNFDLAEIYKDLKAKEKTGSHPIAPLQPSKPTPAIAKTK
jgi:hypothetical protein